MAKYGYIRVSAKDQNEARQYAAVRAAGVRAEHIFLDKQSGKDFHRPAYNRLLQRLRWGDTVVIPSIDRLGRNYEEILEQWRRLTKRLRVGIVVLDMPLLDTAKDRDLTGTLIADIVLQLLSYVAQREREMIRQRQAEGIAAARARGVQFGRKALERPESYEKLVENWRAGRLSSRKAAEYLGISQSTFLKWAQETCEAYER